MPKNTVFYGQIEPQQVDKIGAQGLKPSSTTAPMAKNPTNRYKQISLLKHSKQGLLIIIYRSLVVN